MQRPCKEVGGPQGFLVQFGRSLEWKNGAVRPECFRGGASQHMLDPRTPKDESRPPNL